jgi:hypothetical protein
VSILVSVRSSSSTNTLYTHILTPAHTHAQILSPSGLVSRRKPSPGHLNPSHIVVYTCFLLFSCLVPCPRPNQRRTQRVGGALRVLSVLFPPAQDPSHSHGTSQRVSRFLSVLDIV